MKMTVGKITFTALLTFVSLWAETLAVPILVLAVLMFCDWLTGVVNASMHNELSSRIGMKGIIKKLCYFFVIAVTIATDWGIASIGEPLGADMGNIHVISLLVVTWLIVNESISILENLVSIGVPFPSFLSKIVQRLKTSVEQKGEQLTEEEVEAEDAADAEEDEETK